MDGVVDQNFDIRLVQTIEKYPVIYNTTLEDYNKPYYVRPAWKAIAKEFNCDALTLKKKWTHFRANLSQNIRLRQMGEHVRKYCLYDHMKFVIPFLRISSDPRASPKHIMNEEMEIELKEEYDEENRYQTDPEQNAHAIQIKEEEFQIDVDPIYFASHINDTPSFASHINDTPSPNTSAESQTKRSNIVQNKSNPFLVASAATSVSSGIVRQFETAANSDSEKTTDAILAALTRIEKCQEEILKRVSNVEADLVAVKNIITTMRTAIDQKMPERAEVQAQGQYLRECKVLLVNTNNNVSRFVGDFVSDEQIMLQSLLPISSEETLLKVEEHLKTQAHLDAMTNIIAKFKSSQRTLEKVFQSLFRDVLIWNYNFEGKCGKKALIKLKIVELVFDSFSSVYNDKVLAIKHYISLSHNRYKHVRRNLNLAL